jgi:hypothetical protein
MVTIFISDGMTVKTSNTLIHCLAPPAPMVKGTFLVTMSTNKGCSCCIYNFTTIITSSYLCGSFKLIHIRVDVRNNPPLHLTQGTPVISQPELFFAWEGTLVNEFITCSGLLTLEAQTQYNGSVIKESHSMFYFNV